MTFLSAMIRKGVSQRRGGAAAFGRSCCFLYILLAAAMLWLVPPGDSFAQQPEYRLGIGDRLRVTVFGHDDLSGEFEVSSNGSITLPLIGEVGAANLTLTELEQKITGKLRPDYLKNPQVSAEVLNYRPFYIIGEVRNPGDYPYVGGMRVVNAIAMAGGFTYRADEDGILVTRAAGDGTQVEVSADAPIYPGDVIEVPERFF